MFLQEWGAMAAEFGWAPGDIFGRDGLAFWLETEIVTALGPEHAVTETGRVFARARARIYFRADASRSFAVDR